MTTMHRTLELDHGHWSRHTLVSIIAVLAAVVSLTIWLLLAQVSSDAGSGARHTPTAPVGSQAACHPNPVVPYC